MYRHHPQTLKIIEIIKSGIIGKVKKVFGKCGFDIGKRFLGFEIKKLNYNSRLLNKSLGGGSNFRPGMLSIKYGNSYK